MRDNIEESYQKIVDRPDLIKTTLCKFEEFASRTYDAFKDVISKHTGMGKAAIVIMARNQATHVIDIVRNSCIDANGQQNYKQLVYEITALLAPMYVMMHDRLTKESLEELIAEVEKGVCIDDNQSKGE